jgi:hypothetical protein
MEGLFVWVGCLRVLFGSGRLAPNRQQIAIKRKVINQMNAVQVFNGGGNGGLELPTKEKQLKNGRSVSYVSKKDYGIHTGLKGNELRRAHDRYRADLGVRGNTNIVSMVAQGQLLVQKLTETKTGFNVNFIRATQLDLDKNPVEVAGTLTDEQLMAILESRKAAADKQLESAMAE